MPWITVNSEPPKPTTFEDLGYVQVVRCKDCKWYDEKISICDNCHLPREQTFFCADGKHKQNDTLNQR